MKHTLLALALVASFGSAFAHGYSAQAAGSNALTSNSSSSVSASGTGAATSAAFNQGYAATGVSVGGAVAGGATSSTVNSGGGNILTGVPGVRTTTDTRSGNVDVHGYTQTANMSGVVTTQTGTASATGAASGTAVANANGVGQFHTTTGGPAGSASGHSNATSNSGVQASGNGSFLVNGGMNSGFNAASSADLKTVTVQNVRSSIFGTSVVSQPSQSDVKNVATSTDGFAVSNAGFSGAPAIVNSGNAVGYLTNTGVGAANANASVRAAVSANVAGSN